MSFRRYPAAETNNSIGLNGQPIPANSTLIAGTNGGTQTPVKVNSSGDIQVDVVSTALPTGAATAAKQDTGNASLASIDSKLTNPLPVSGSVSVSNFPASQPITGSVSVTNFPATQNVAVTSSVEVEVKNDTGNPVPVSGTVSAKVQDGSGNSISSTGGALNVNVSGGTVTASNPSVSSTGSAVPANATFVGGTDGTNLRALSVDTSGKLNINNISGTVSLPTGAATAYNQTLVQSSVGVSTGTAITIQGGVGGVAVPVSVSGTVAASQSGSWSVSASQAGTWTSGRTWSLNSSGDSVNIGSVLNPVAISNFPATQPVSGSVSVSNFPATQAVSGTVTANIGTTNGLALDATVSNIQGSATGGTAASKSELTGGIYNSSAPTLTTGQQAALQLDSSGNLKVAATVTGGSGLSDTLWLDSTNQYFVYRDTGSGAFAAIAVPAGTSYSPTGTIQPVPTSDFQASGTITTQNLVPGGTATAGSAVAIALSGKGTVTIQVTGVYTGALSPQVTTDGVNWITQGAGSLINMGTGAITGTIPSASVGIWQIEVNGHAQFRISANAAVTGTATITLRAANGTSQVSANQGVNGAIGQAWYQRITDGTSVSAVKAASTAPLATDPALVVAISPNTPAIKSVATNSVGQFVRNDYTVTSVTTAAYTQLIASTSAAYSALEIFDSSGQTLKLAIGGAGSEVDQFLIFPGGNGRIPFTVAAGSRISIRAVSATASAGEIDINFYV